MDLDPVLAQQLVAAIMKDKVSIGMTYKTTYQPDV